MEKEKHEGEREHTGAQRRTEARTRETATVSKGNRGRQRRWRGKGNRCRAAVNKICPPAPNGAPRRKTL